MKIEDIKLLDHGSPITLVSWAHPVLQNVQGNPWHGIKYAGWEKFALFG